MMIKLNPGVFLFTLQLCAVYVIVGIYGELSDMKIVEEPSSFGLGNSFGHVSLHRDDTLQLRIQPANFSGPPHFKRLLGRCFSSVINDYKYKLCPFSNITQHEQGIHWNPYKGVLGAKGEVGLTFQCLPMAVTTEDLLLMGRVWQEWEVVNNTFVAMVMRDGDSCGRIYRSLKVTFMCGNHSQIVNVSEPKTCCYHLVFMTPLVCHPDSMLVYPTLSPDLQKQWDSLEGVMARGELTAKGYKKRLDNILEKAGIYLSSEFRAQLLKDSEDVNKVKDRPFDSVDKCQEEVEKLKERIKNLTSLLGVSDHSDQNTARNTTQIHFDG